jgi:hypothetical protein
MRIPVDPRCPQCRGQVDRIPRRLRDRMLSLVVPVHRFQCRACAWKGLLRAGSGGPVSRRARG